MKRFYKMISLFLALCFISSTLTASTVDGTEIQLNVVKKLDEELSSEKIQKTKSKLYKKLKRLVSEQKQAKLIDNLSNSTLSPTQQAAVLEVLDEINVVEGD